MTKGKVPKAVLMAKLLEQMFIVAKLMQQVHEGLVRQGRRPMVDHVEMMVMFGGMEVGLVVGTKLTMSEWIQVNMKP